MSSMAEKKKKHECYIACINSVLILQHVLLLLKALTGLMAYGMWCVLIMTKVMPPCRPCCDQQRGCILSESARLRETMNK